MCAAEIEDFLRRSKRPKVHRDTSIGSEVNNISNNQEFIEVQETQPITDPEEQKVASTVRLRKSISKALNNLKSEQGITKDAFIEAAWEICQQNEEVMKLISQQATAINDHRRKQGILLRAESAIKNLKG
ncbi:hypothetical protein [Phormidium tenue]|uniref:Uncharacterized protein n=1 Tax=Phormidium tenue FACHB-1050 TaxID=2692857 RepID=A0ABR8C819_9CYAN|nr:hypothetical protein [Phormidium tenue]MBD2316491.1 hypothetical protein [Phormidium tenue FACHB-1050]